MSNSKRISGFQDLIQEIPKDCQYRYLDGKPLKADERKIIADLSKSAENASVFHIPGLSAIGELLVHAADEVQPHTLRDIGWLIRGLSEQLFHLSHLQQSCDETLSQDDLIKVKVTTPAQGVMK